MITQKPIIKCDFCKKEIDQKSQYIKTSDVPYEGYSGIHVMNNKNADYFEVGEQDYCNIDCFFNDVKKGILE